MKQRNTFFTILVMCTVFSAHSAGQDSSKNLDRLKGEYTRGIAPDGKATDKKIQTPSSSKLGVEYHIFTETGEAVSSAHHFRSGDRFKLQFRVNQEGYVYVLNRTVPGSSLSRGIGVEPASKATAYKLLHPRGKPEGNHVVPDRTVVLPPDGFFRMDQVPGEEKVIIVVSPTPIDIAKYFKIETGDYVPPSRPNASGDVEAELSRDLRQWNDNAEFAEAPDTSDSRGIHVDRVESFGIARDPKKPMVLVLDLNHLDQDKSPDLDRLKGEYSRGIAPDGKASDKKMQSTSGQKLGVEYHILTDSGEAVSSAHHFRSGDRFKLKFHVNQDSYVYVLNRTVAGSSLSRGIDVEPGSKATAYKLIHPRGKSEGNHVVADRSVVLPPDGFFRMDNLSGEEKVVIVVSRDPIDIAKYFKIETGDYVETPRSDSSRDVEAQLNHDLRQWSDNAEFAEAPATAQSRGIQVDRVESVGIARDSKRPMVLVLDLNHLPN